MSVMEISHRSVLYEEMFQTAKADLRELLAVPKDYKILFLQGGASTQFTTVPLNLARKTKNIARNAETNCHSICLANRPCPSWHPTAKKP